MSAPVHEDKLLQLGLTSARVGELQRQVGFNEIPSAIHRSWLSILVGVAKEPMILLLMACAAIYLVVGDTRDGLILLTSVFLVLGITLFQELKSERALEALKDLSSPRAFVIRDGRKIRIPGREVMPGDIAILQEGDRVPADGVVVRSDHLEVDESLLTGESFPVQKAKDSRAYSGTVIVRGSGYCRIEATGAGTEIGKIGRSLQTVMDESTLLQRQVRKLVKIFGIIGILFSGAIAVTYGLTRGDWPQGMLAGLAAAMSLLPEEIPLAMTIFFALGAWRMSKVRVLTRQMTAIENLGSISVLCVDKTGTLTRNQMQVKEILGDANLLSVAALASRRDPFDPMEKAIHAALGEEKENRDWDIVREYPLSSELFAMSHVWAPPAGTPEIVAAKGAPEAILELCRLPREEQNTILQEVQRMARGGLRVLGVAKAKPNAVLPESQREFEFQYLGLLGLEDPLRPQVPQAVRECYDAGIRVIMMTGDYPVTAQKIAQEAGLNHNGRVTTGEELLKMSEAEVAAHILETNVFARMVPEQKLKIVEALKKHGEIVAMTGDGVNDAPSLKRADVGIAMGERGTDVAREASDIVLLDDDFTSIVTAVRMGRRIYDNIQKSMAYIFSLHVPIAGIAILPVIFKMPLVLMPIHIVLLELLIDPACTMAFEAEPEEPKVMQRPPRDSKAPVFGIKNVIRASLQGFIGLVFVFGLFFAVNYFGKPAEVSRTMAFVSLVLVNVGLIFANLSWAHSLSPTLLKENRVAAWILAGAALLLGMLIYVPVFHSVLGFSALALSDILLCLGAAISAMLTIRILRLGQNIEQVE